MVDVTIALESIRDDQREKYWHYTRGRVHMGRSEVAGSKGLMGKRPFVKEIVGITAKGRPVKRDVPGKKSHVEANQIGSRGVRYWYTLQDRRCYLIQQQTSRRRARQFYVAVAEGRIVEIDESLAIAYGEGLSHAN